MPSAAPWVTMGVLSLRVAGLLSWARENKAMSQRTHLMAALCAAVLASAGAAVAYELAGGRWGVAGAITGAVTGAFAPSVFDMLRGKGAGRERWREIAEKRPPQSLARLLDPRRPRGPPRPPHQRRRRRPDPLHPRSTVAARPPRPARRRHQGTARHPAPDLPARRRPCVCRKPGPGHAPPVAGRRAGVLRWPGLRIFRGRLRRPWGRCLPVQCERELGESVLDDLRTQLASILDQGGDGPVVGQKIGGAEGVNAALRRGLGEQKDEHGRQAARARPGLATTAISATPSPICSYRAIATPRPVAVLRCCRRGS